MPSRDFRQIKLPQPVDWQEWQSQYQLATENFVGLLPLPVGIAGPLEFEFNRQKLSSWFPLATTEGALVASVNRGAKALRLAGGAKTQVTNHGVTRSVVYHVPDHQAEFIQYCQNETDQLQTVIKQVSQHTNLMGVETRTVGERVFVRYRFDTDLAMGMNMATLAAQAVSDYLLTRVASARVISLSSNYCSDKKTTAVNWIAGRGREVFAQVDLPSSVIKQVLKTTPQDLVEQYQAKLVLGSYLAGTWSHNAHHANMIAGFYLATGQDPAHLVSAGQGLTQVELIDQQLLRVSVHVNELMLGLVGGGTALPMQSKVLALVNHQQSVDQLAAVLGTGVLAGEISLLAALASQQLASAHQRLGRKKNKA